MLFRALPGAGEFPETRRLVNEAFLAVLPVANILQWYTIVGNADSTEKDTPTNGGDARDLNESYAGITTATDQAVATLVTYGDKIKTDAALRRRGESLEDLHTAKVKKFSGWLGRNFMHRLVWWGNPRTTKSFNGMKHLVKTENKFYFTDNGAANGNGVVIPADNSTASKKVQKELVEQIKEVIAVVGDPSCVMMDALLRNRISSVASEFIRTETIQNAFNGMTQTVRFFDEIPIIDTGKYRYWNAGTSKYVTKRILDYDQTFGNKANCTSIIVPRFGEKEGLSVATNKGMDVMNTWATDVHFETRAEFDCDLVLIDDDALATIDGICLK